MANNIKNCKYNKFTKQTIKPIVNEIAKFLKTWEAKIIKRYIYKDED